MLKISDRMYNIIKWFAQYLLSAAGTFLGVLLGISTVRHKGGKGLCGTE